MNKNNWKVALGIIATIIFLFTGIGRSQIENFKQADLVLGAPDLLTVGTQANNASGIDNPNGVAVDPYSGKVFVTATAHHRVLRFGSFDQLVNGSPAEAVLGQADFAGSQSGIANNKFSSPNNLIIDMIGRLWVSDSANNRIVMFRNAVNLANGSPADLVLGQPDFNTNSSGNSASKMYGPVGIFVDKSDNLWVADSNNNRVLKFVSVSSAMNGAAASVVIGQPDFGSTGMGTSATGMRYPISVAVDANDSLWVGDYNNNRVLRFDSASGLGFGAAASGVLGQSTFNVGGTGLAANRFNGPGGLMIDPNGTLWVVEFQNHRVLAFLNASVKADGASADHVLGQSDFTTKTQGTSAGRLSFPSQGIARDPSGNLWVTDRGNHRVVRYPGVSQDANLPILTVVSRVPKITTKARISVSGVSSDPGMVRGVNFRVGKGGFRPATGTTTWSFIAPLRKHTRNVVQVYSEDFAGNRSALRTYRILRR